MQEKKISTNKSPKQEHGKSNSKSMKDKNKNRKILIIVSIIGMALILAIAVILFVLFGKDPDINTAKIMSRLSAEITSIQDVTNYSEANDPNGVLGQDNWYSSKETLINSKLKTLC